jgi:1,4-dihydroxy-2-naphthoate octaprenyltransferase
VKIIYLWQVVKLTRMPIVLAVIPIFLIGVLFALRTGVEFSLPNFLWGFSILFIIEIAASFANDYFDYEADKHNKQFGFSGGSGVLLAYPELLPFAKWSSILMFLSALILTGAFVISTSFPLWGIGYIGIAVFFCWFYTAPPLRFVYRGLGEMPHLLAGVMFPGWGYFILTGALTLDLLIFAIPFGLLGLTVILNFEIPDREADLHGEKQNLIVKKGRYFGFATVFSLYLTTLLYFIILTAVRWSENTLNFLVISLLCLIPVFVSSTAVIKKPIQQQEATTYAIRNAVAGFLTTFLIMVTLIF